MTRTFTLLAAAAMAVAAPARGEAKTFRYDATPGARRVFQFKTQTEMIVTSPEGKTRRVLEVPIRREILVVETQADPAETRVVIAEVPGIQRLIAYEKNGTSQLEMIPESRRTQALPPLLASHRQDPTGRPVKGPDEPKQAMQAIDRAVAELRFLPKQPIGPETPVTWKVDLGIATLTVTTTYAETVRASGTESVVLDATGDLVFTGDLGERIAVETLKTRSIWALDGSGLVSQRGTLVLEEKAGESTQRITRTWEEQLAESGQLTPEALAEAKANLGIIEQAMTDAGAGKFDEALKALETYVANHPKGAWTPAVRNLQMSLAQRKIVSQPAPPARLRLMLRDLQARRDQAGAGGGKEQVARFDQTLRQIASVNAKQILMDAADPDPIVRDLATFGLAFLDDPQAAPQLKGLVNDPSAQVRGTALVSLAIREEPIKPAVLKKRLADEDARTRAAAALVARTTLEPGSPTVKEVLPAILNILTTDLPWARSTATVSLVRLAPKGHAGAVKALIDAHAAETENALKQLYRAALKDLTGVEADTVEPYRAWLKEHGGAASSAPKTPGTDTPAPKG